MNTMKPPVNNRENSGIGTLNEKLFGLLAIGIVMTLLLALAWPLQSVAVESDQGSMEITFEDGLFPAEELLDPQADYAGSGATDADDMEVLFTEYFRDDFTGWSGWTCHGRTSDHSPGCCNYGIVSNSLRLTPNAPCTGRGDPWCDLPPPYRNIWLRPLPFPAPANDFVVEARVHGNFNFDYSQCGVIVWFNQNQYVKLVKARDNGRKLQLLAEGFGITDGGHCPRERKRERTWDSGTSDTLTLVVEPSGNSVLIRSCVNNQCGSGWNIGQFGLPTWSASGVGGCSFPPVYVGVICYGSVPQAYENTCSIDWFRVRSK